MAVMVSSFDDVLGLPGPSCHPYLYWEVLALTGTWHYLVRTTSRI